MPFRLPRLRGARGRAQSSLVWPFAVRAALAFLVVGVLVHVLVGRQIYERYQSFAEFHAVFVTESVLRDHLVVAGLDEPFQGDRYNDLDRFVQTRVLKDGLFRLKIWRSDGTVLFSDERRLVGEHFPDHVHELEEAIARGPISELTTLDLDENTFDRGERSAALETYVPLLVGGDAAAVVELYQDLTETRAAAAHFTRVLDAILVVGLLGLYAMLLPIARRTGRNLEEQKTELQTLLGREQETVQRLEDLGAMKDTFLSAVSHELRTPLTIVMGVAQMLERRPDLSTETRQRLVQRLSVNAVRLNELLASLLDLDRLSRGVVTPERRPTDLTALVMRVRAQYPDAEVQVLLPPLIVDVDPAQMERVVENLLANAVRHTSDGTEIEVRGEARGRDVLLAVDDRGPGVPDDLKEEVFLPFRQGPSLRPHTPGTGVGLSLVAGFVELHGGRVWVEDRPGGGASFRVLLPDALLRVGAEPEPRPAGVR